MICNDFLNRKCSRQDCKYQHVCSYFWKFNNCKFNDKCQYEHVQNQQAQKSSPNQRSEPRTSEPRTSEQRYQEAREKRQTISDKRYEKAIIQKQRTENRTENRRENRRENRTQQESKPKPKRNKEKYNKNKDRNDTIKRIKNTESFNPIYENQTDLRIVFHNTNDKSFDKVLSKKDVLIVPDLFKDFYEGELYKQLLDEITNCDIPKDILFKLWHGDSHLIADDHLHWKTKCPTFNLIVSRIQKYFNMDIKATRFNYYPDSSTFKPMHFDASAVKPEKAKIQNFTLAISFGTTRDAAFEHANTKTIISLPQNDSCIYAFCKDINITWRHGILKRDRLQAEGGVEGGVEGGIEGGVEGGIQDEGRISIICWGWLDQTN